jgi:hypothetical protein
MHFVYELINIAEHPKEDAIIYPSEVISVKTGIQQLSVFTTLLYMRIMIQSQMWIRLA